MIRVMIFFLLTISASAQVLQPASPREMVYDGRVYARSLDNDSLILVNIPVRSAITAIYLLPEDTLWVAHASIIIATEFGEIMTWTTEVAGLDDCLGCLAADWPLTAGDLIYRKSAQTLVARFTGVTGDNRGTMRIIVKYIELF